MNSKELKDKLRVGWHLYQNDLPCDIPISNGINYHTAILAQSGSGKSFFLGRFIEELLIVSKAKVIIFDPNGDFRHFNRCGNPWGKDSVKKWFGKDKESIIERDIEPPKEEKNGNCGTINISNFEKNVWPNINIKYIINDLSRANSLLPKMNFQKLELEDQLTALGLSKKDNPSEVMLYRDLLTDFIADYYNLELLDKKINTILKQPVSSLKDSRNDSWGNINIPEFSKTYLRNLILNLAELKIWENNEGVDALDEIDFTNSDWDCLITDLASIKRLDEKMLLMNSFLDKLLNDAYNRWENSMEEKTKANDPNNFIDNRIPIFVVIDEAHSIVSEGTENPFTSSIFEKVQRIVSEGRKYGVFLIISTQRPSKIPSTILSECDNLCLLRLNSIVEKQHVHNIWGISNEDLEQVSHFDKGDCLLHGRWVPSTFFIHGAPRRTMEGGVDLDKSWQQSRIKIDNSL